MVRQASEPLHAHTEQLDRELPVPIAKSRPLFQWDDGSGSGPKNPSIATLWRWMQVGIVNPNGERVRLRYTLIGRRRFIEPSAAREFLAACNAVPATATAAPKGAASAALVAMGY